MANEYLERNAAARKQLGKKGLKKRVKQLPTAVGEVAAYISEGPKETRGKYQELGVSGFKVIAGAMARAASSAAKAGNVQAFEEAMSLSRSAGLAARFPNSAGAKRIVNTLKQTMIGHKGSGGPSGVTGGILQRSGYRIPREDSIAVARGAAKVIGKSAGGDPGVINIGKEFGNIARQPKTPYFNKETNRFVNPEAGPYQVRATSTGKVNLTDNVIRGYPVGGPNADRISRLSQKSQKELIARNVQRDIQREIARQRTLKNPPKRGR